MKWTKAHKWLIGITAVPTLAIGFLIFSFGEPCACYTPTMELAMYIDLPSYTDVPTLEDVTHGFVRKFPVGRQPSDDSLLRFKEEKGYSTIIKTNDAWVCTYWLEASLVAKKGYRVTIALDTGGKVRSTQAVWLESWFGIELESHGDTA